MQVFQNQGTIYRFQASWIELFIVWTPEQIGVLLNPRFNIKRRWHNGYMA